MYTCSLNKYLDPAIYGAKGCHLSEMRSAGFPVPNGFAISSDAFIKFHRNSADIDELTKQIALELKIVGAKQYMVRSSAIGEDAEDTSFAGQLDSYLSEANIENIISNVKKCWASYDKENVRSYQNLTGKQLKGMGVVVQELIDPDHAGVIFTRSHLIPDHMLVEYVKGHGEQLVSGNITPKQFHYSIDDGIIKGDFLMGMENGIEIARKIEIFYKHPVDIEWAMKKGVFYVVQARPITTPIKQKNIYWSNTNVNENYPDPISPLLYSVARQSYYHYFKNLSRMFSISNEDIRKLEGAYSNIIGVFGCKMYYNMSSIHQILSASPFSEMLISSFDDFVGYTEGNKANKRTSDLFQKLKFLKEFIQKNRQLEANVREFEQMTDQFTQRVNTSIVFNDAKFTFHEFIEIRMHSWYRASLADFYAMTFHGLLGKFCNKYFDENGTGIQNKLIQAIPGIISSKPVIDMHQIITEVRNNNDVYLKFKELSPADFYAWLKQNKVSNTINDLIHKYLQSWGFRCSGELMLTSSNYIENPESFIALLMQYEKLPERDPEKIIAIKHQEALQTKRAVIKKIWFKYWWFFPFAIFQVGLFKYLMKKAITGISSRERVRLKQALLYFGFKKTINNLEDDLIKKSILKNKGDILFMSYSEIAENIEASAILPASIKEEINNRKNEYQKQSKLKYPDDFYTVNGKYAAPNEVITKSGKESDNKTLSGLCACGGTITGQIKVLETVLEASKLNKGDILVTRQTDPGWVVVFPLISGLIVERGGMLSHGAIVSREFGIPAIVGVDNATQLLKDGDIVLLNADKGEISIRE